MVHSYFWILNSKEKTEKGFFFFSPPSLPIATENELRRVGVKFKARVLQARGGWVVELAAKGVEGAKGLCRFRGAMDKYLNRDSLQATEQAYFEPQRIGDWQSIKRKYCICLPFSYSKVGNAGDTWLTGLEESWLNMTVLCKHTCAEDFKMKAERNYFSLVINYFCSITFTFTSHIWTFNKSDFFLNRKWYKQGICLNFEFFNSVCNSAGGKKSLCTSCDTHQDPFQTRGTE